MTIEVLFPEVANLFGDMCNIRYLSACLPEAEVVRTPLGAIPHFAGEEVSFLYMGPMTERAQLRAVTSLAPYAGELRSLMERGTPALFTGNAMEVLGEEIVQENGETAKGLGILPVRATQDLFHRYNGLAMGTFAGSERPVLGFQSQFTAHTVLSQSTPFLKLTRGRGFENEAGTEGLYIGKTVATTLLGPLLILNPDLTRRLLKALGAPPVPAYAETVDAAYEARLREFTHLKK